MVEHSKKLIGINATCFSDRPSGAKNRFVGFFRNIFNANHDINFVVYIPRRGTTARFAREGPVYICTGDSRPKAVCLILPQHVLFL